MMHCERPVDLSSGSFSAKLSLIIFYLYHLWMIIVPILLLQSASHHIIL